jgi:hypothetical protein
MPIKFCNVTFCKFNDLDNRNISKIVLDNYQNMLSAFYLLLGTTIMFVGLAYFQKSIKSDTSNE